MSLLEDLEFHPKEGYVDISDEEHTFSMAVFGLGAAALISEVQTEVRIALTPSSTNTNH